MSRKPNRRSRRRGRDGGKRPSDSFRIVVAASPPPEPTIEPELDLIKAALLYGDRVTLLSPTTTMFLGVEKLGRFSLLQQTQLMRKLAPYFDDARDATNAVEGIDAVEFVLRGADGRNAVLLRAQLADRFRPAQEEFSREVSEIARKGKADELARARTEGLLRIEDLDPSATSDMVVWCIDAAKRSENSEPTDPTHTDLLARRIR